MKTNEFDKGSEFVFLKDLVAKMSFRNDMQRTFH